MPVQSTPSRHTQSTLTAAKPMSPPAHLNPSQWLNFSLPPRHVPGSGGLSGPPPRRSKRAEGWRGSAMTRERYVHANFRFVLKPSEMGSYGAHFADPDISIYWPHILQVLVPTFSAFSVAQGYVDSDPSATRHDDDLGRSFEDEEFEGMGEEAAERRRRVEEERRGRMCPICLGKPVAGRMTKCGHIFCFPCILHYIQLSDIPKSAKCPICGDTVHEGMLKSVKYLDAGNMLGSAHGDDEEGLHAAGSSKSGSSVHGDEQEHVGIVGHMDGFEEGKVTVQDNGDAEAGASFHRIHMRLVQRPQMTTLALPSSSTWPSDAIPPHTAPWHFLPDVLSYSRLMLATPEYMIAQLDRELAELKAEWEMLRGDTLGRDFVKVAREKVERQVGKVKGELMGDLVRRGERESREAWGEAVGGERKERERARERDRRARERESARDKEILGDLPTEFLAAGTNTYAIPPNLHVEPNPMPTPRKNRRKTPASIPSIATPPSPSYHFYQSSLGANVYLHPLDIRILLAHFQSYALFPPTLTFNSNGFDTGTINDEMRKRCKYLSHLPLGTEVVFVEAELEEIVGKDSLAAFEQPLRARREKRKARTKKEDRAKTRWEKAERDKMPVTLTVPSAGREDTEFALALARSTVEVSADPYLGTSASSSTSNPLLQLVTGPSPSTSPSNVNHWGAHPQPRASFAHALHSRTTSTQPVRRQEGTDWEVDAAWEAFEGLSARGQRAEVNMDDDEGDEIVGSARETERGGGGGGGKKAKKGQKKKLVLGGGGGRRA